MNSPRWWVLRQLILEEEAFCFLTTAFCFDVNVFHSLLSSSTYVLYTHQAVTLSYFVIFTPSFFQIHTSIKHLKPKMEKQSFHFSFFFFRPAEQHQTWPQRPPHCKSAPPTNNAVQIGYKQQTTDHRYIAILALILRCNSSYGRCSVSFWKGHPNLGIALWLILLWTPRAGLRLNRSKNLWVSIPQLQVEVKFDILSDTNNARSVVSARWVLACGQKYL